MQTIKRYTAELQKLLHSKTKPEPWLHCVVLYDDVYASAYAIYVWDTRQIIETGKSATKFRPGDVFSIPAAKDNRQPLQGQNADKFKLEQHSNAMPTNTRPPDAVSKRYTSIADCLADADVYASGGTKQGMSERTYLMTCKRALGNDYIAFKQKYDKLKQHYRNK